MQRCNEELVKGNSPKAFASGSKVTKSPTRQRSLSVADIKNKEMESSNIIADEEETVRRGTKRKRVPSFSEDTVGDKDEEKREKLIRVLETMEMLAPQLALWVEKAPNTRNELKKVAMAASRLGESISLNGLIEYAKYSGSHNRSQKGVNIQTQTEDNTAGRNKEAQLSKEEVWKIMNPEAAYEDFAQTAKQLWPSDSFRRVCEVKEDLPYTLTDALAFSFADENHCNLGGASQLYMGKLTESEIVARAGKVAHLQTRIDLPGTAKDEQTSQAFCLFTRNNKDEVNPEVMYLCLGELKKRAVAAGVKGLAMPRIECGRKRLPWNIVKKMLESRFSDTQIIIKVYNGGDAEQKRTWASAARETRNRPDRRAGTAGAIQDGAKLRKRRDKREAILIKSEGKSYADLVKTIKSGVDQQKAGAVITGMRKTRAGDLLISVEKGEGKIQALADDIGQIDSINAVTLRNNRTIRILDLDATITKEEIQSDIAKILERKETSLEIKSLRIGSSGNQAATISLAEEEAEKLLSLKQVKIGWVRCRVREWVEVEECYRCFGYGHRAGNCSGVDARGRCKACGEKGHIAKECTAVKLHCLLCKVEGHKCGTLMCPQYKAALKAAREATVSRSGLYK